MSLFDSIRLGASGVSAGYEIERSIRLEKSQSMYLSRTAGNPTNQNKFSYSCWVKRTKVFDGSMVMYGGGGGSQTNSNAEALLYFVGSDQIASVYQGGLASCNVGWFMKATRKLRDPSAWMHFLSVWDGTLSGDSNRIKFYVNGVQDPLEHDCGSTSAGFAYLNKNGSTQYIGRMDAGSGPYYASFYLAEAYFVDGTACVPSDFIETSSTTGQVVPKNSEDVLSGLTMGNNGFYLNFSDNSNTTASTLGKDYSGNNNNWTPHNFNTNDIVQDSPTNNWAVLNINDKSNDTRLEISNGNLKAYASHGFRTVRSTFGVSSGKWYWEARLISWGDSFIGITDAEENISSTTRGAETANSAMIRQNNGNLRTNGGDAPYGNSQSNGDILGFALDMDNGKFYISENGTFYNSGNPANGTNAGKTGITGTVCPAAAPYDYRSCYFNFGQDDTFDGAQTSQGNTDGNGLGKFKYAPPSGFLALCSANLPNPSVVDGKKHFNTLTYSGNNSTNTITGLDFQPDWVSVKRRNGTASGNLVDSVRGVRKHIETDSSDAEQTESAGKNLTSFNSNGFTLGSDNSGSGQINTSGGTFVAWCWKAGTSFSNSAGYNSATLASSGSINASAGLAIISYTGNGSSNTNIKIAHGLGVKPAGIWLKNRSSGSQWRGWHQSLSTDGSYVIKNIIMNSSGSENNYGSQLRDLDSSTFTVRDVDANGNASVNKNGDNYIAYVFSEVEGYSKFGQYPGNSDSTRGTFVYLGFKPALVIIKKKNGDDNWEIHDNVRDPENPADRALFLNSTAGESTGRNIDFCSNGFCQRNANGNTNESGYTYIYYAWAESPFKFANGR